MLILWFLDSLLEFNKVCWGQNNLDSSSDTRLWLFMSDVVWGVCLNNYSLPTYLAFPICFMSSYILSKKFHSFLIMSTETWLQCKQITLWKSQHERESRPQTCICTMDVTWQMWQEWQKEALSTLSHTEGNWGKSEGALTIMDGTFKLRCGRL